MNKMTPQIRFQGFTDDWEERKLGDITKISTGKLDANAMVENGKYDFYTSGIKKYRIDIPAFEGPAITIAGNGATVGYMHLADNKFNAYQRTYVLQDFVVDRSFLFSEVGNKLPKKINQEARTGNIPYIVMDMLTQLKLSIPQDEAEQSKIGSFFKQLDNTIALHQRMLDLLKEQKKGFLQKMFPKNGAKVPELRFSGFDDDWEERKFDECFKFPVSTNSLSRALLNYDEGDIKSVHYGDILIKYPSILNVKNDKIPYITDGKLEKYKSSLLENGDLIFADAAEDETVGKAVEVNGLTEENLVSGLHTIVARSKDKKAEFFLGYYVNSNIYHRQLLKLMQGSKVSSISKGNLQKTLVSFPKDFEEQQKIGSFFKQLDETIALHQRKLDLLKEQKKGFLQKMFVS